jgi:serine O-acetyltransferase
VEKISSGVADWSREEPRQFWDPSRKLLRSIRQYQKHRNNSFYSKIICKLAVVKHRFWSAITGADIPLNSTLGGGLLIPHPNGIVIHPDAEVGVNCLVFQQVTIGSRDGGIPCVGGHVDVGAGAKIIGKIKVGDHARIGCNAVVLNDVPPNGVAVGIPAKVINNVK